ncbi:hypothetical protein D9757_004530 [Collybiopsis confluens]|uniref:Uncharacterized protein n=1 Tax=Collybiopsis confluens TaxID=2823264 RepID=A0A8H5HWW1_9AGAR|nr:hypothetical protein D9757_004530 [Collybiopsis confluens]
MTNPNSTDEAEFYGPYNNYLFPYDQGFQVTPQYRGPVAPGSIDYVTTYLITHYKDLSEEEIPVMFIEVKPPTMLRYPGTRGAADTQMRERYSILGSLAQIPRLYGISAIGRRICIYKYTTDQRRLEPRAIPRDEVVNDTAPET